MSKKNIISDQTGAVTLDWLVLTAAIVGLGIAVLSSVSNKFFHPEIKAVEATQK